MSSPNTNPSLFTPRPPLHQHHHHRHHHHPHHHQPPVSTTRDFLSPCSPPPAHLDPAFDPSATTPATPPPRNLPPNANAWDTSIDVVVESQPEDRREERSIPTGWPAWNSDGAREHLSVPLDLARASQHHAGVSDVPVESAGDDTSSATPASWKGRKRASTTPYQTGDHDQPSAEPSHKRLKLQPQSKHYLDTFPVAPASFDQATSPLFFSNSPRPRPSLPPRFSSSEAAAKMLSKARGEDSHVRTVSLARGVVTTPQIPTSVPLQQNRKSIERAPTTGRSSSPESNSGSGGGGGGSRDLGAVLGSIGIIELLDQDERPTFIVDLGDGSNYGPGLLHMVYANLALRSSTTLEQMVCGAPTEDVALSPNHHLQFKSWLLSAAVNGESLNVCLPSFVYANMSWSCSTLRKRLRIISGSFMLAAANRSSVRPFYPSIPPTTTAEAPQMDALLDSSTIDTTEGTDYFGPAIKNLPQGDLSDGSTMNADPVPSIEPLSSLDPSSNGVRSSLLEALPMERELSGTLSSVQPTHAAVTPSSGLPPEISTPSSIDHALTRMASLPPEAPSFDWTRLPISDSMPKHIQFARSVDWASTSLGPIESWTSDLRQMCNLIMASPHPAAMYWGENNVALYNEAYIVLAGQKHPRLMGQPYSEAWAEIWDDLVEVFTNAKNTGEATMKDDDCLFILRSDRLEETYFSWSIIPLVGDDGSVKGLYNPAFEKTRRKIAERRMLTLRELGERTSSARDVKSFWSQVLGSFEFNEHDSPFLLLYSVTDEHDSDTSSVHSNSVFATRQCFLEGSLGVPSEHVAAPIQIDLKAGYEGFGPVFREVMKTDKPVLLEVGSKELPKSLLEGLEWRGFGDPVRSVVVCPIHPTTGESILGFLVLGVNPRRPYDDDYSLFVQLLSRQLATSLASVVLFEEEIRRGQKAAKLAALDRIELSQQLAARTQEAIDSETKFTRMAEFAPVGMFIAGSDGRITFANDTWYDISRVPKNSQMADTWMDFVNSEDHELVKRLWQDLVVGAKPVSSEFRFKAQWEDRSGNRGDTWVLFSGYPEKHEDGRLKSVFGSITNISSQKWAEGIQTRKMEEAVELKRQQENFIDITSHEMRNPLSAILQCSDEIASTLTMFKQSEERIIPDDLVTSCLDAAQIISLCSQHQKRIVDDILTLSKLDSQLLLVTPVDAQPLTVVKRALKMHEGELQAADIQMKLVVDQSYRDLELDWVRLDPSRVMQVLINLTTNAIKFTGTESRRSITVTISASRTRPSDMADAPVKYFPTRNKRHDIMQQKDWGDGETIYIHFSVKDTGRGLNPEEKQLLFMRFSQASPRTHVQYGGSGLGLFISRELTELQGGEIGVDSEAGKGSTFAFYVVARRIPPAEDADGATGLKRASFSSLNTLSPAASPTKKRQDAAASALTPLTQRASNASGQPFVRRVLIVEDNLVNQKVLQKQLKNMGTEVHLANHGGEALEKLRQSTYWAADEHDSALSERLELGVVLMDQEMPVMDGLTCTRRIRELEKEGRLTGHVPIIAVTANARAEQVQTALGAGMDDVVSKPFRIPELLPKIDELMQKYPAPGSDRSVVS